MRDFILLLMQLTILVLFGWFLWNMQSVVDRSVAQAFESYLELNGYNDI